MKYWPFAIVTTEAPATATSAFAFLRNSNHFRLISPPPLVWISKAAVGYCSFAINQERSIKGRHKVLKEINEKVISDY